MHFDPIITISLFGGLWQILPILAATSSSVRTPFINGVYCRYSRIALKIRGASIMMKMSLENIRIKQDIISHINRVFPRKHNSMCIIQDLCTKLYKQQRKAYNWTTLLMFDMGFGHLRFPLTIFYLVQYGVFLMKYGFDDTWMFKMVEIHVDYAIFNILRTHPNLKDKKTTYRRVVSEALHSDFSFLFLYTFQSNRYNELKKLAQWSKLIFVMRRCDKTTSDQCLERLPSGAKGGIALLALIANIRKNKQITNNSRVCFSSYRDYMEII